MGATQQADAVTPAFEIPMGIRRLEHAWNVAGAFSSAGRPRDHTCVVNQRDDRTHVITCSHSRIAIRHQRLRVYAKENYKPGIVDQADRGVARAFLPTRWSRGGNIWVIVTLDA